MSNQNNNIARRSGRTIRIVDKLVQDYFKKGKIVAKDHPHNGHESSMRNREVWKKVVGRLLVEHNIDLRNSKPSVDKNGALVYEKPKIDVKKFVDGFYEKYGGMISKLSHE
jgi:hypothetical protein